MTAGPQPALSPFHHEGSKDDHHARDTAHGDSTPDTEQIPHPRQSGTTGANQFRATLAASPDGALWVTVDGADVQQVAAKISAVCDALISAQPR